MAKKEKDILTEIIRMTNKAIEEYKKESKRYIKKKSEKRKK